LKQTRVPKSKKLGNWVSQVVSSLLHLEENRVKGIKSSAVQRTVWHG